MMQVFRQRSEESETEALTNKLTNWLKYRKYITSHQWNTSEHEA